MSEPALILRRANLSRPCGSWSATDYDVFDGDRDVRCIYLIDGYGVNETWFGGELPTHRPQELRARINTQ
jgi:hypothetical protein